MQIIQYFAGSGRIRLDGCLWYGTNDNLHLVIRITGLRYLNLIARAFTAIVDSVRVGGGGV
jgi:hypothetical protein